MLGYIGGKQFEEQPWKGVLVGLAIAFTVAFVIEWVRNRRAKKALPPRSRSRPTRIREVSRHGRDRLPRLASCSGSRRTRPGERVEIRDAEAVRALFERVRPDVVIHTAYRQDGDGAREIVVDGSANVARAPPRSARGSSISRRMSSSTAARARRTSRRTRRRRAPPYGRAKAEAEDACRAAAPGRAASSARR